MFPQSLLEVFRGSLQDIFAGFVEFIPNIVVAVVIFVIGWVIGAILGRVVSQIVKSIKVDNALRSIGVEDILNRGGFALNSGAFLGALVKWFIIIVFLVGSLEVLELSQVTLFLQDVVLLYLPNVIAAVLILLVAAVIAEVMQSLVVGGAKAAEFSSAHLLGSVTRWAIWIFAILAALDQLNVASAFVQTLFTGVVVALSLAVGLAFGLGGQQAAANYIEKLRTEISNKRR